MQQYFMYTLLPESIYIFLYKKPFNPIVYPAIAAYKNNVAIIVALLIPYRNCRIS